MTNRMSKFCFGSNSAAIFDRVVSQWNLPESADAALQCIDSANGVSIILILSDVNMPGMTGMLTSDRIRMI